MNRNGRLRAHVVYEKYGVKIWKDHCAECDPEYWWEFAEFESEIFGSFAAAAFDFLLFKENGFKD